MKHLLHSLVFTLLSFNFLSAQHCVPDTLYADSMFGVYPAAITESACINQPYYFVLTLVVPDSVVIPQGTFVLDSIEITGVSGLPSGMDYGCNPSTCVFFPEDGMTCAAIFGTADDSNSPGDYTLTLEGGVTVPIFGHIPFSTLFAFLMIPPYVLTLEEENSGTCFVNTEEPLNDLISIETSPNPFQTTTNVRIYSEMNEELTFEVYTLLGNRVHSEAVNLTPGENTLTFDGAHLAAGFYYFNFSDGQSALTQKMLIQR